MPEHIKLSELTREIETVIEKGFRDKLYYVLGETIEIRNKIANRQCYFKLIEKEESTGNIITEINATIWGNSYDLISMFEKDTGQSFKDNIQILVKVKVIYHKKYGLKLDILDIDSSFTLGNLELERRKTLGRLVSENPDKIKLINGEYLTFNKSLPFKLVIQNIALVSSSGTDGHNDFLKLITNNQRQFKFNITNYNTQIQGVNAASSIKEQLITIYNSKIDYDAVVIVRGGGTQVDFNIFDNYDLCRTVARFPIPIITGIGHERNEAIIDIMARKKTNAPTHAAAFILDNNIVFEENIYVLQKTIIIKTQQLFSLHFQALSSLNSKVVNKVRDVITGYKDSLVRINQVTINKSKSIIYDNKNSLSTIASQILSKPKIILYNRIHDIKNTIENIKTFNSQYLKNQKGYLGHYSSVIKMMAPDNILKKGFAIIKVNDKITSDPNDVIIGKEMDIILSDTQIKSKVIHKSKYNGTDFNI